MTLVTMAGFAWLRVPSHHAAHDPVPVRKLIRNSQVATCGVVVLLASATITMFEPVFVLYIEAKLGIGPAKIGTLFAAAALANTIFHPLVGRAADRWGARRLTGIGLIATSCVLPIVTLAGSFGTAMALCVLQAMTFALVATPSLTFMGDATSASGLGSFGTAYGFYNAIWAVGLLFGPAVGGYLFERVRFSSLTFGWAAVVVAITLALPVFRSAPTAPRSPASPTGAKF
jgi:MFS family permease